MCAATDSTVQDPNGSIATRLAAELGVREAQVQATIALFDEGATVPFVARYRKEVTGGLDDVQLRKLDERLTYLRELDERRLAVLASIEEQGKLTPTLRAQILAADTKTRLEDLYLPYKKKRRTKAQIARESGLEPLAHGILADPTMDPTGAAAAFVDPSKDVADVDAALEGARQILMEEFAEDPELVGSLREFVWNTAQVRTLLAGADKEQEGAKFRDWFDHAEAFASVPSHRALAFLRGRKDGILRLRVRLDAEDEDLAADGRGICVGRVLERFGIREQGRPADRWLIDTARLAWKVKLSLHIETELVSRLRESAEEEAIAVFARNLHDLLLAAPAGNKRILGLDPGLRTGVKVAVVDATGKVVDTATIYPTPPRNDVEGSLAILAHLVEKHSVDLVSIGNGTGSRETDRVAVELLSRLRAKGRRLDKVVTNEAGASVYSASELASKELPDLDVSLRGAVSIARRVQDPLAELVKIEPKSIGVGQYQHDVSQTRLGRALEGVVEDCVNAVGVDVNTASAALLARVAGLTPTLAESVVAYRNQHGAFQKRKDILQVPRLGPKAFEQAAGFLRIPDGDDPLDSSAVHPESYEIVRRIEKRSGRSVRDLLGDAAFLRSLDAREFTDERFGEPTVRDILAELEKPGRDPRPEWKSATFQEGVEDLADLKPGMQLEGVVTNVANFGAFVDLGVHQDGLVHISRMSDRYVADPREVVKVGQVVRVKVMEVDLARKRVALTMRMQDEPGDEAAQRRGGQPAGERGEQRGEQRRSERGRDARPRESRGPAPAPSRPEPEVPNAFARAFAKLERDKGRDAR